MLKWKEFRESADWFESLSDTDRQAIEKGIEQLDNDEYVTQSNVRTKIKEKYNF